MINFIRTSKYLLCAGAFSMLATSCDEFFNCVGDVMTGKMTVDEWIAKMVDISNQVKDKVVQ